MIEQKTKGLHRKLKSFTIKCIRVLKIIKKPSGQEFKVIVKISGLGILIIGFLGFLLTYMKSLMGF